MKSTRTIGLPLLLAILYFAMLVPRCNAQEVPLNEQNLVGTKLVNQANHVAQEVAGRFQRAITGDPQALAELVTNYVIPAATALLVVFIGYLVASYSGRAIGVAVSRKIDLTLGKFLSKMIRNVILALIVMVTLAHFGIDITSFAAMLAAAGFTVGMALQGTLANFAAGVMLLVFRPFKIGDYIIVAETEGEVDEIDLFTTRLNSLDNRHLIVPNAQIFGKSMVNFTHNKYRRVDVAVSVEYKADLRHTRTVLERAVNEVSGIAEDPAPIAYLVDLGESAVNWQIRVWCDSHEYWQIREKVTMAAKEALDRNGIGIPFPQIDVHVGGRVMTRAA